MNRNLAKVLVLIMVVGIFFVVQPVSAWGSPGELTMIDVGTPGYSYAVDINNRGQVLVWGDDALLVPHTWIWENGTLTDPGTPGGYGFWLSAINELGQAVGRYMYDCYDDPEVGVLCNRHALLYGVKGMTDLGTLGGTESAAFAINKGGQIVGWSNTATGELRACLWENGRITDLGTLGGAFSFPASFGGYSSGITEGQKALNDRGQVVGASSTLDCWTSEEGEYLCAIHAFLWEKGTMTDLGTLGGPWSYPYAINNRGQVVGGSSGNAFLWENGTMTDLGKLGGCEAEATGINERGQIIGYSYIDDGCEDIHAFLWENGTMTDLGTLGGPSSYPEAINEHGQVVGYSWTSPLGPLHAFLWEKGTMKDLGTLSGNFGWPLAINNSGEIAGFSTIVDPADPENDIVRAVVWTK